MKQWIKIWHIQKKEWEGLLLENGAGNNWSFQTKIMNIFLRSRWMWMTLRLASFRQYEQYKQTKAFSSNHLQFEWDIVANLYRVTINIYAPAQLKESCNWFPSFTLLLWHIVTLVSSGVIVSEIPTVLLFAAQSSVMLYCREIMLNDGRSIVNDIHPSLSLIVLTSASGKTEINYKIKFTSLVY